MQVFRAFILQKRPVENDGAWSAGVSARFFVKGSQSHDLAKLGGFSDLQVWWPLSAGVPPTEEPGHQSLEVRRAQSAPVQ